MKYLILFTFFIFSFVKFNVAQDLIVLSNGDSLNCMITMVDNKYVYFSYKDDYGNLINTAVPKAKLINFTREFYGKIQPTQVDSSRYRALQKKFIFKFPKFFLGLHGGLSHLSAKIPEDIPRDFEEYYKNLKWGSHYGFDFGYIISEKFCIGFKHSVFRTYNSIQVGVIDTTTGQITYGLMQDDIKTRFYGPSIFYFTHSPDNRWFFMIGFSFGYLDYINHFILIDKYLLTGNTIGVNYDFNLDLRLDNNLALVSGISMMTGSLSEMIVDDGTTKEVLRFQEDEEIGLSRFDFFLGVRWYL